MRIFVDTASLSEIEEWDTHPWVSGFTTNPSLMRAAYADGLKDLGMGWAKEAVKLTDKPISIDGPPEVWDLGSNVVRKVVEMPYLWTDGTRDGFLRAINHTAIMRPQQLGEHYSPDDIISVFAGRIMDTGRSPQPAILAAKSRGAQVLWASVREPYNIGQADEYGCDIVTVPPAILRKYLDWNGKPLEVVEAETVNQFERDREGLW